LAFVCIPHVSMGGVSVRRLAYGRGISYFRWFMLSFQEELMETASSAILSDSTSVTVISIGSRRMHMAVCMAK